MMAFYTQQIEPANAELERLIKMVRPMIDGGSIMVGEW